MTDVTAEEYGCVPSMAPVFLMQARVYYEDTDSGGVVYYANYLKFMERARTEYLRSLGFQHSGPAASGDSGSAEQGAAPAVQFVVRDAHMKFVKPAKLDDLLDVSVLVSRLGNAGLDVDQVVSVGGQTVCSATIGLACVSAESLKPARIPAVVKQAMTHKIVEQHHQ